MKPKVIIVDDEKVVNFITRRLLSQLAPDIEIIEFTDPQEALEALPLHHPALTFLDLNMPKTNGWDFLNQMAERKLNEKVVVQSSSVSSHDQHRATTYNNVIAFIEKPAKKEALRDCLQKIGLL
ncbi:MAG: response regulator [Chitinophagia bacterium]|nr:response regulator [Chitinophagia bacterium]